MQDEIFGIGIAAALLLAAPGTALARPGTSAQIERGVARTDSGTGSFQSEDNSFIRVTPVEAEANRYEVTLSGKSFGSRDKAEGYLLYRAALFAQQSGRGWFRLLHLPGEDGPEAHPARRSPAFGEEYAHWQPHWSYYQAGTGWQPWRPEWGVPFFADHGDSRVVERFEVHAMIELGQGAKPSDMQMAFDTMKVVKDLKPLADANTP
jgi:hypothetical protein